MTRTPVTHTFFLDMRTGHGYMVSQVGTGQSAAYVVKVAEKSPTGDTWVITNRERRFYSNAEIERAICRWQENERGVWTTAVVSPDESWTLRTVAPATGIPATVPYTIEEN